MNIGLDPQLVCTQPGYKSSCVQVVSGPGFISISSDNDIIFGALLYSLEYNSQWAKRMVGWNCHHVTVVA